MKIEKVSLEEILYSRERRVVIQKKLIEKYRKPLISFTMNIPGNIKTNENIEKAFQFGKEELKKELKKENIKVIEKYEINEKTGNEIFLVLDTEAEKIKDMTVRIEEKNSLGRIFDIDVISVSGEKISRKNYRRCFICDKQAQECARNRNHSFEELHKKIEEIIRINKL